GSEVLRYLSKSAAGWRRASLELVVEEAHGRSSERLDARQGRAGCERHMASKATVETVGAVNSMTRGDGEQESEYVVNDPKPVLAISRRPIVSVGPRINPDPTRQAARRKEQRVSAEVKLQEHATDADQVLQPSALGSNTVHEEGRTERGAGSPGE